MNKVEECLEILRRGGVHTSKEMGEELGIEPIEVGRLVRKIRKVCLNSSKAPYVFTTPNGYTLEPKPSDVIFESNMRLKFSVGVIVGGMPCFNKAKKIASSQLATLKAQYKPELIRIGNIF